MKKLLPIFAAVIVIAGVGVFFFLRKNNPTGSPTKKVSQQPIVDTIIEENPYVTLVPRADGHEFKLEIRNLRNSDVVEYELAYMAGEFSRGAIGEIKLSGDSSLTRSLLLGSESCSGTGVNRVCKYRYDEGVKDGTLTLRFRKGNSRQKVEIPFKLQRGIEAQQGLTSADGIFEFKGALPASAYFTVFSTLGVPKQPTGKIVNGPYNITTAGSITTKGIVKVLLKGATPNLKLQILGWNGSQWEEYRKDLKNDGESISVSVDRLTTYVVVAP